MLPVMLSHTPSGASIKQLEHFGQLMKSGHFRKFDRGYLRNQLEYNRITPPDYDLSKVKVPVALYYSMNDMLVSTTGVDRLARELPNMIDKYLVPMEKFNHLDFLWAIDVKSLVYNRLVRNIRRVENYKQKQTLQINASIQQLNARLQQQHLQLLRQQQQQQQQEELRERQQLENQQQQRSGNIRLGSNISPLISNVNLNSNTISSASHITISGRLHSLGGTVQSTYPSILPKFLPPTAPTLSLKPTLSIPTTLPFVNKNSNQELSVIDADIHPVYKPIVNAHETIDQDSVTNSNIPLHSMSVWFSNAESNMEVTTTIVPPADFSEMSGKLVKGRT